MRVANRSANNEREIDGGIEWMTGQRPAREATEARPKPSEYERDSFESTPREREQRLAQARMRALDGALSQRREPCCKNGDPALRLGGLSATELTQGTEPVCLSASAVVALLASINALAPGERSAEFASRLDLLIRNGGVPASREVREIRDRCRRGEPIRQADLATIANFLDRAFCVRQTDGASTPPFDVAVEFMNEHLAVSRLFGIEGTDRARLVGLQRPHSLSQLAEPLAAAMETGSFAMVTGNCRETAHAISITRINGGYCWHDTRDATNGQRRTFSAPTIGALIAEVQGAVARQQYDFVIHPMPPGTSTAENHFAARVYSHQLEQRTQGAQR
ncbi:MAG: hypothetical protein U0269_25940 [Polyangiales bacterium]